MTYPAGPYALPVATRLRLLDCAKLAGKVAGAKADIGTIALLSAKLQDTGYWSKCPNCGTASLAIALAAASAVQVWCACGWRAQIRYGPEKETP